MHQGELIPHLFKAEFSKITAVLCKRFGIGHIEVAEDITSETFLAALETWTYQGIPENPSAWLYAVAKNKTRNFLHRKNIGERVANAIEVPTIENSQSDIDLSEENITDSQLQMLFAICHPALPVESQIGLALRILCGFGIDEIATAFLTNRETINKRLFRAKEKLRVEKIRIEFPSDAEINQRLDTVLTTLYLFYSEGYYSESHDSVLREDLCSEAMRITQLLMQNESTNTPSVKALFSLMCFHSSRFAARRNKSGALVLYQEQDETLWDADLIAKGAWYLKKASEGDKISKYHLEAGIAYWHTNKSDTKEKWENILQLYNQLLQQEYSPIAALNRTYALSKANGKAEAIAEAEKLKLNDNQYYFALLGELYTGIDNVKARQNFTKAQELAKTPTDRRIIQTKLDKL